MNSHSPHRTRASHDATRNHRRAYGQNFLVAKGVAERITQEFLARVKQLPQPLAVLEIGPGEGALTHSLPRPLTVAEMDPAIAKRWASEPQITVLEGDAVETLPSWLAKQPNEVAIVANLPYNASTAILSRLLEFASRIPLMILMFQREVAQKLRSQPGERDVGPLSLQAQNLYDLARLFIVNPGSFQPRPNVDSEVVLFERLPRPRYAETQKLRSLSFKAFAHRRKMLRHNLKQVPTALQTRRPHELSWQDWGTLLESEQA